MFLKQVFLLAAFLLAASACRAEDPVFVPNFFDPKQRLERPDTSSIRVIRFMTDDDYPPFHFLGADGQLTGFNVELARLICEELQIACTIQARRWDTLKEALLDTRSGDAIIASQAIPRDSQTDYAFSHPYYRTPARFIVARSSTLDAATPRTLSKAVIGVIGRSAHEAFLANYFPQSQRRAFEDLAEARRALREGRVDAVFADGVTLAIWLNAEDGANCCRFLGGPYLESHYFGEGVGITTRKDAESKPLLDAINYALARLARDGRYAALYLKYFPVGFF